jgi:hypothetical protein
MWYLWGVSDLEEVPVSHDSGFRRGGRDLTNRQNPRFAARGRGSRRFEERMEKRFHEHERRTATPPSAEDDPAADR